MTVRLSGAGRGWIDYQSGQATEGGRWHELTAGAIPIVLQIRSGAVTPHVAVAQSTADIDWGRVELRVFRCRRGPAAGHFFLPGGELEELRLRAVGGSHPLERDPLAGLVQWRVSRIGVR